MKSERAKQFIKEHEWMDTEVGTTATYSVYACNAVELAEQEAEERMRKKAIDAFKNLCFHRDNDKCSISYGINDDGDYDAGEKCDEYCKHCTSLKNFIQKLTEE